MPSPQDRRLTARPRMRGDLLLDPYGRCSASVSSVPTSTSNGVSIWPLLDNLLAMSSPPEVDVLLVCASSTHGHRRREAEMMAALKDLGVSAEETSPDYRWIGWLQFTTPLIDLSRALLMRRATTRACREVCPRALIYATSPAAILERRSRLRKGAICYDALTRENRLGWRGLIQRVLEVRSLRASRMLMPLAITDIPGRDDLVEHPLPMPVAPSGPPVNEPGTYVVCYAGDPVRKGLDTMIVAWALLGAKDRCLLVAGIDEHAAKRFLARRGVKVPDSVRWLGSVPPVEFRAMVRGAAAYLAASRYEGYGIAQLEALADGTPLVTTPSRGPFEALGVIRELAPDLVADTDSAEALSVSLQSALDWDNDKRVLFRSATAARMAEYSPEAMRRRFREILPELLSDHGVDARPG